MDYLASLSSLIHKQQIDVVGIKGDKVDELLNYLTIRRNYEEDTLEAILYPQNTNSRRYFKQLKRSLRQRLLNTLFATDPQKKDYWDVYFDIGKKNLAANLLWNKGKNKVAASVAGEALKVSIRHECTLFSYSLSRRLANHYALIVSNPVKYRKYHALSQVFLEKHNWEAKAEDYYYDLAFHFRQKKTVDEKLIEKAETYHKELLRAPANVSWNFEFIKTLLSVILGKLKNDGPNVITACETALSYFDTVGFQVPVLTIRSINFHIIPAYIDAGRFDAAMVSIQKVKQLITKTGYNWIAIHQYETIVAFYSNDMSLATAAIAEIQKSKLSSRIREEVRVYETFYSFLTGATIRIGTFLNDTPKFSLDKKGMNINRVILRVLILLSRNDRSGIIDQVEALEMYAYRHLKNDPTTRRSQIFLRLLFLTVRHSFDWPTIQKQTAKTYAELLATPRHLSTIDIEVVPYEVLWGRVGELLG